MVAEEMVEVEEGLGTVGRIRILRELARGRGRMLSKYALAKATGLKRADVDRNLKHLVKIGWVKECEGTHLRYQINMENSKVMHLIEFFRKTGYI